MYFLSSRLCLLALLLLAFQSSAQARSSYPTLKFTVARASALTDLPTTRFPAELVSHQVQDRIHSSWSRESLNGASKTEEEDQTEIWSSLPHLRRDGELTFALNSTFTNASFADWLCQTVTETTSKVTIIGLSGRFYAIPECLREKGENVASLLTTGMVLDSFANLPQSLTWLSVSSGRFIPNATREVAGTGFEQNGNVYWNDVWLLLPNIEMISVLNSYLAGSLPSALPSNLLSTQFVNCRLSGTIPATIFSNVLSAPSNAFKSFSFFLSTASITGTLPSTLFVPLSVNISSFQFILTGTQVGGSIPSNLFAPLQNFGTNMFEVLLSSNRFNGSLPENLFPSGLLNTSTSPTLAAIFTFDVSFNYLTGSIPPTLFHSLSSFSAFSFAARSNGLTGSLPASLFAPPWSTLPRSGLFNLVLNSNLLSGTIPPTLITNGISKNSTFTSIAINLVNNSLSGTIPERLFYIDTESILKRDDNSFSSDEKETSSFLERSSSSSQAGIIERTCIKSNNGINIYLGSNNLTGSLPAGLYNCTAWTTLQNIILDVSYNNLNGTIPDALFAPLPDIALTSPAFTFNFGHNAFSGSPSSVCWPHNAVKMDLSYNELDGDIPETWGSCSFSTVDLSYNPSLDTPIPPSLLTNTKLQSLTAINTPLSGTLPETVSSSLTLLNLANTAIDFCASPSTSMSSFSGTCNFTGTNACECSNAFDQCALGCSSSSPTATPFVTPLDAPVESPPAPSEVPSTSEVPSPPLSAPSPCSEATRPSSDFSCVLGVWTATSTNGTTLNVPPNSGVIVVVNLTSSTIVFHGTGSTVNITGTALYLTTVTIELTAAQVSSLSGSKTLQILINTNNGNGSTSNGIQLGQVNVNSRVTSGCKKVKVQKVVLNEGQTLAAYLSVDSSGCNRWWIILVSVVVALIVLVLIVLVLLAAFCKPFREKVRPYSKARSAPKLAN